MTCWNCACLLALSLAASTPLTLSGALQPTAPLSTADLLTSLSHAGVSAGAIVREDGVLDRQLLSPQLSSQGKDDIDALVQAFADTHAELRVVKGPVLRIYDPTIGGSFRVVQHGLIDNETLPTAFALIARLLELRPSPLIGGIAGSGHPETLRRVTMQINAMKTDQLLDEFVRLTPGTVWQVTRARRGSEDVDLLSVRFPNGDVLRHLPPIQLFIQGK